MPLKLQISLILGVAIYFTIIFYLLRKGKLLLKYTLLWMLTGIVMLILAIYPQVMEYIIQLIGIYDVTNGLFTIAIFFIMVILMSLTSIVSKLRNQNKDLVQHIALLEKRLRGIEKDEVIR